MLMTVPGRRTGTLHELPVMYARDGDSLWVLAGHAETKSWWRNLVLPAEVGVRVRGKDCRATARAIIGARDPIAASRGLDVWVRRFPKAGPKVGVRVSGHRPDASDIDRAVLQSVVVRVRLGAQQESAGRAARALALIGIVGPIFYIVLVTVLGLLWQGYDPIRDTQSELGAVASPDGTLMNVAGFMGLGLVILAFAAAYRMVLRRSAASGLAVLALVIAGTGMVVVGFFPCDAACVDVTRTGRLHGTFSMPGAVGLPVAAMLSASALRSDGRFGVGWQTVSFWIGLLALVSGPIVAAGLVEGTLGLVQRAAMWPPLIWMTAVSIKLFSLAPRTVDGGQAAAPFLRTGGRMGPETKGVA
jgi:hypothetical protein